MKLSKSEREILRMMFGGKCAYCGCELPEKGWHADHVEPVLREWWKKRTKVEYEMVDGTPVLVEVKQKIGVERPENDVVANMFPSCAPCNIDKAANSLEGWRNWLQYRIVTALRNNSSTFRHAERFGRVSINPAPLMFWFERYTTEQPTQPSAEKAGK